MAFFKRRQTPPDAGPRVYSAPERAAFNKVDWEGAGGIPGSQLPPTPLGGDFDAHDRAALAKSAQHGGFPYRYWKPNPGVPGHDIQCSAMAKGHAKVVLVHKPDPEDASYAAANNYWWKVRG